MCDFEGCGLLGGSRLLDCTVICSTELFYKRSEAPRAQKCGTLATLKQKKARFLLFAKKRSRCVTLLGCGHLGDSELKECTAILFTEPPYKGAEAPRSKEVVGLATLKQKKSLFLLFCKTKVQVWATLLGCGHLQESELKECTVIYCTEAHYKNAEAPGSKEVVGLATLKQKKALFLIFCNKKRSRSVTLLGCGHLGDSEFNECTVISCTE